MESGNATASLGQPVTHTLSRSAPASRSPRARAAASAAPSTVAPPNSHTPPLAPIQEPAEMTRGPGTRPCAIASRSRTPAPPAEPRSTTVVKPARSVASAFESGSPARVRWTWASMRPGRTGAPLEIHHLGAGRRFPVRLRWLERDDPAAADHDGAVRMQGAGARVEPAAAAEDERAVGGRRGRGRGGRGTRVGGAVREQKHQRQRSHSESQHKGKVKVRAGSRDCAGCGRPPPSSPPRAGGRPASRGSRGETVRRAPASGEDLLTLRAPS